MDAERRAVLEGIAFGDAASPGERLRALELLREDGGEHSACRCFAEVHDWPEEELAKWEDLHLAAVVEGVVAGDDDVIAAYPTVVATLTHAFEQRVRESVDADRIEREIDRLAQERAEAFYVTRGIQAATEAANASWADPEPPAVPGASEPAPAI